MVAPREVVPGRIYLCTRRCTQRQFRLLPDDATTQAFSYCLAYAAFVTGCRIIAFYAGSNHHHLVVQDVQGRLPDFFKLFHTNLAKHQNAHHGLVENMWSAEKTSAVWCVDTDDFVDKVVYLLTNPVKDGLVENVEHWPGALSLQETLEGHTTLVARPKKYFDPNGAMPDELQLTCGLPQGVDRDSFVERVRDGIMRVETESRRVRLQEGKRVLGVSAILRQRPTDSPSSRTPKFKLNPQVASRARLARLAALQRLKAFRAAYEEARTAWLLGQPATFPFGTWWLRRHANVPCADCSD